MNLPSALRRSAPWLVAAVVLGLVAVQAREVDWPQVRGALRQLPLPTIGLSVLIAAAAHAVYAAFDLVGRALTEPRIGRWRTWGIAAIVYAFNLNLGALIGGLGMRLRLYTRWGLPPATVAQIAGHCVLTNWVGWCWVAGLVLLLAPPSLSAGWAPGPQALRAAGAGVLLLALAYQAVCSVSRRKTLQWRRHTLERAGPRLALLQAAAGAVNWLLMALSLWNLLQGRVGFAVALGAIVLAAVAGILVRVPGSVGVFETVVVTAIAGAVPTHEALAAVLAFRAVHYLLPLALALPAYGLIEWAGKDPKRGTNKRCKEQDTKRRRFA